MTFSTKSVKLLALTITALTVLALSLISRERPASASVDSALEEIAAYRSWTKVTKDPIKVATPSGRSNAASDEKGLSTGVTIDPGASDIGG